MPELEVGIQAAEQKAALKAEVGRLQDDNNGKERLLDLLHSSYRNERIWGIKLSAEFDITEGIVVERIRDIAAVDPVKAVRKAAADRLGAIEASMQTGRSGKRWKR